MTRIHHSLCFGLCAVVFSTGAAWAQAPSDGKYQFDDQPPAHVGAAHDPLQQPIGRTEARTQKTDSQATQQRPGTGGTIVQTVLGLAFVLCLILVVAAWAKKHFPHANKTLPSEAVQLLGQRAIGQRQMIQLIRCGSRILIVGSTQQGLTTLGEVTDPVEVDYLAGLCRQEQPNSVTSAFAQLFQNYRDTAAETGDAGGPLRSIGEKLGWSRTTPSPANRTPSPAPPRETPVDSAASSLKERLGRLGTAGDAPRLRPRDGEETA